MTVIVGGLLGPFILVGGYGATTPAPVFAAGLGDQFPPRQFPRRQFPSRQFPRQKIVPFLPSIDPRAAQQTILATPSWYDIDPSAAQYASSS